MNMEHSHFKVKWQPFGI